ncbi:glycosyltransferase family 2 protein [Synechococcus sp. PCC 7336]|uniref:glycosyltransferase family 2 protein n=1 Tax=Synechococcus sp. PCC 7336 TaxID=195250 RepID=UPI00034C315B|nr:glycosyltransferase family 2 protein [Synechococcus sp. PCC 7336]
MAKSDCFVSVIAPLYNHSQIVEAFVDEVIQVLRNNYTNYELVLVDDVSEDDTAQKAALLLKEYECIRLIELSRHFGTEVAISSGLDSVIGDFVVVMLPQSDPPGLIPRLIEQCRTGKDILIGVRQNRRGEPFWMRAGANSFYWCCKRLFKIPLTKNATQFWVLSRQVVNALVQVRDKYRYLRLLSAYVGYRSQTFIYEPIRRYRRVRAKSLIESINLGLQIIFFNSANPLRLASLLSLFSSLLNLIYILYVALVYLFKERVVEGWVTLSIQNAFMFFFISIILAILCEYIGLMFVKSRGWAAYYIAGEKNSSILIADKERRNIVNDSRNIKI